MPDERDPEKYSSKEWKTIQRFQRAPIRLGCLGCTLTGWAAILAALAAALLLAYALLRLWF